MDKLFSTLMGSFSNPAKTITIVAENFSLLEDQARFLKATLAIPAIKKVPLDNLSKRLIQIGPLQHELGKQVRDLKWDLNQYEDFGESICDRLEEDLSCIRGRSLIFINDVSRLELASSDPNESYKLLRLVEKLRITGQHFIVLFYQCSTPQSTNTLLRDMEYMSQAVARVKSCKAGYFKSMWWEDVPELDLKPYWNKNVPTLIRPKVITYYCTCKIGKSYWEGDKLCFYDKKQVPKNYDLDNDTYLDETSDGEENSDPDDVSEKLSTKINKMDIAQPSLIDTTLHPYAQAQNPEQSRIFYYPDKDDDIDEDDPDNDLGI